jgi:hypothetical protein
VKFETLPSFTRDYARLRPEHRASFRTALKDFITACNGYAADPSTFTWPAALRVSRMRGTGSIWEMTWSFASPDGRATFEFVVIDGAMTCRWRRIGDHSVYKQP